MFSGENALAIFGPRFELKPLLALNFARMKSPCSPRIRKRNPVSSLMLLADVVLFLKAGGSDNPSQFLSVMSTTMVLPSSRFKSPEGIFRECDGFRIAQLVVD